MESSSGPDDRCFGEGGDRRATDSGDAEVSRSFHELLNGLVLTEVELALELETDRDERGSCCRSMDTRPRARGRGQGPDGGCPRKDAIREARPLSEDEVPLSLKDLAGV